MKYKILLAALVFVALCNLFFNVAEPTPATQTATLVAENARATNALLTQMREACEKNNGTKLQVLFSASRNQFKRIEFITEYYFRNLSRQINGPALPFSYGEASLEILQPEGFQCIEEIIFPKYDKAQKQHLLKLIDLLINNFKQIENPRFGYGFQDKYVLDAIRYEIYRISAQGISGFDSPVANHIIAETDAALEGIRQTINFFKPEDESKKASLMALIVQAQQQLAKERNANRFDRLAFLTTYLNPISNKLLALQVNLGYEVPQERRVLKVSTPSLFDMQSYNPSAFSPNPNSDATPEKIKLGEQLFYDRLLSANNTVSCGSCHQPEKAFADGLKTSIGVDGNPTKRNAPTLLNVAYQREQFYDSRTEFLEDQVFDVVHNAAEMGGSLHQVAQKLKDNTHYKPLFDQAFPNSKESITVDNITNVLASYLRALTSLDARFDKYMAGNTTILNQDEKDGFNLFMGKAKCGSCHYVPLFNGVAPPYFAESESEVLGVPDHSDKKRAKLDKDLGKYDFVFGKTEIFKYSFKTPTLRNIELTAPYMHNGVFKTLEEVVDFYNDGGGKGWGIAPENQTLSEDKLKLSKKEKMKIIAFLKTLTDTTSYKKNLTASK